MATITRPAAVPATVALEALDALEAEFTATIRDINGRPDMTDKDRAEMLRLIEQRQGVRAAVACARIAVSHAARA